MPDVALIAEAVDFIEAHLKADIAVADMAEAVSYSVYYFCRMFNRVTHHTPYDYLMRRRLSEAARALLQTDRKIIDIAFDYQFNSPETFSRAFKRVFGTPPSQVRRQGRVDGRRLMPRLTRAHIEHINQAYAAGRDVEGYAVGGGVEGYAVGRGIEGTYLRPVLEERDAFWVAGVMTWVRQDRAVVSELWDLLVRELARGGGAPASGDYYGIAYSPGDWEGRGFLYMAGIEVQGRQIAAPALVLKRVPALRCARFVHKGPTRDLPLTLDYVYHTWLPKSGERLTSSLIVEGYGREVGDLDSEEAERAIYVPIEPEGFKNPS
jgi:AraC family transcriptional regulator